jgi:hypothetical protein
VVDAPKSWVTGPSPVMTQDEDDNAGWVSSHDETALVDRFVAHWTWRVLIAVIASTTERGSKNSKRETPILTE